MPKKGQRKRQRKEPKQPAGRRAATRVPRVEKSAPSSPAVSALPAPAATQHHAPVAGTPAFPVVAVGASAGGLEAFSQVLEHLTPAAELAVVLVQHLAPHHASSLPELLTAKTRLRVATATDRTRMEPGTVYVMPPNVHMDVIDGELHLLPRPTDRTQFTPIDFFMQSLARWAQDRAIGVILSGTASDGAAGIREIKAFGGITIAQLPETAKHDGMPRAAIATGLVDLVLPPEKIGEHLGAVPRHPYLQAAPGGVGGPELSLAEAQLRELFVVLRRASGIDFRQYKAPTLRRRLLRRMALLRLTDIDAYLRHLLDTPAEAKALSRDLLIHVTRFFRDPDAFETMATHVFAELFSERSDDPIRIWVPGCATGEEAYSIGICLFEALGDRAIERRIQIFATDVSEGAIEHARAGMYPVSIAADVSPDRLKRFFAKADGAFRVVKPLRDVCVFARHDLTRDPPFSRLDFVVCRNVLIYLDAAMQKRLMSVFHYALKPRGFLMLGPAETTGPHAHFAVVDKKWRLFRKTAADVALPLTLPPDIAGGSTLPGERSRTPAEGKTVQDQATRLIVDRYGPPGVIIDANWQIVQFRGHTGPYLEAASGDPNLSVLKMARGGLLHPLRSALQQARRRSRVVRRDRIHVQRNGDWVEIGLEVIPLTTARGDHYLVLFDDAKSAPRAKWRAAAGRSKPGRPAAVDRDSEVRVSDLRRELAASREYLQSIIQELEAANEELQSANEEILSSNEELQSTNEELDTAKEELQSTNEELNTVNEELHSRNEELTRVNSDLTNLLSSVDIPIVIVGSDLAIRRFTPRAEQLFNLIPGDLGRPIGQIKPNFAGDDLEALIRETIEAIAPRERDVQDRFGRWLSLRVRPYKGVDNRLDGAVLSVIDIDASRQHQAYVERSRDFFRGIVDAIGRPLVVLDSQGRVRAANRSFYKTFELKPELTEGRELARVGDGRWDGSLLAGLVAEVLRRKASSTRTIDHERGRRLRFVADPLPLDDAGEGILIAIEELGHGEEKGEERGQSIN